jgi:hypothetical protein
MLKPQPLMLVLFACVACGSNFEAGGSGGANGGGGAPQAGETGLGGELSNGASAGESSGGSDAAGESSSGGSAAAGRGGAAHGGTSAGGTSAGGTSAGGTSAGGTSAGGASAGNAAGGAAGADCAALKTEYAALVKKARVCDEGSTDQCTISSKAPVIGCGCPTLVNAKSDSTTLAAEKYQAIQKAGCDNGPICEIACLPPMSASCAKSSGMGSSEFVCTGMSGIAN